MNAREPKVIADADACVDAVIERVGKRIVLALPLALGKPGHFVNALYRRTKADSSLQLRIVTALSLNRPTAGSDLERRFLGPFLDRIFGDYPDLDYVSALRSGNLPPNVEVTEFFLNAGQYLNNSLQQQNYISSNYTHIARDMMALGVNVCAQLVSKSEKANGTAYSLSSNPDLTLDIVKAVREREAQGTPAAIVGQVNTKLPFMYHDAMVAPSTFDLIIENPSYEHQLFGPPNMAITDADHMIGLYASTLIRDGGTLQVGIGSLGDAIAYATCLRHRENASYRELVSDLGITDRFAPVIGQTGGTGTFEQGLYGSSEMFVGGFMELYKAGILKREVYPHTAIQRLVNEGKISRTGEVRPGVLEALREAGAIHERLSAKDVSFLQSSGVLRDNISFEEDHIRTPDGLQIPVDLSDPADLSRLNEHCLGNRLKGGVIMHGGFFLGSRDFYAWLNAMDPIERRRFAMTSVMFVNHLFGNQALATAQRQDARLLNTTMMVTLSGAACSDALEDGRVVSGVGGQYNFVAMAHELPGARSILMLRSTRSKAGKTTSNIVGHYGHVTIPRHLRDIVVTEYGIADLRGKSDKEIIAELLKVTDSRFQDELLGQAKRAGKIPTDYAIAPAFRNNTPEQLAAALKPFKAKGYFPTFPFGTDFTPEELVLGKILNALKAKLAGPAAIAKALAGAAEAGKPPEAAMPYLQRMQLDRPDTLRDRMARRLIVAELKAQGLL
jgi:acyl-CoA hydrolase